MRCWSLLTSTRCEPDRLVSLHPSRFSAASTRAALAMDSTVNEGSDKTACLPRQRRGFAAFTSSRGPPQCQDMMIPAEPASEPSSLGPLADQLRLAVAAYLARFKGSSREHTESDLRCYLLWCAESNLDPLAAQRLHLELYIR
jgi:hypothetical protein